MSILNSTIELDFNQFIRWWMRELAFLVPDKLRELFQDHQGYLIARPENGQLALSYYYRGNTEALGLIPANDIGKDALKNLKANDGRLDKAYVVLRLTGAQALARELVLPAAAKENLQQVIGYEMDRFTPFKPGQVYFSVKTLEAVTEQGQLRVLLVLALKSQLDNCYANLKIVGLTADLADYDGEINTLEDKNGRYNLLPPELRKPESLLTRLIYGGMAGLAVILALSALVLPVWFEYLAVDELEEKARVLSREAKKIEAMQTEIDGIVAQAKQLVDEKTAAPAIISMLETLSANIKDDTWLTFAQYADKHWQIQGESPAASSLIGILEASESFSNARFVSPVTQDKSTDLERFQITFDVAAKAAKAENGQP